MNNITKYVLTILFLGLLFFYFDCTDDEKPPINPSSSNTTTTVTTTTTSWTGVVDEFLVNTYTECSQYSPSVSVDNTGNFVITWASSEHQTFNGEAWEYDEDVDGVFAQVFDLNGSLVGTEIHVNDYISNVQAHPVSVMMPNGDFIIVWHGEGTEDGASTPSRNDYGIYGRKFSNNGGTFTPGNEFLVNTFIDFQQSYPDIAIDGSNNFIVVWQSISQIYQSRCEIYGQLFDSDGIKVGSETLINSVYTGEPEDAPSKGRPKVDCTNDGRFVVTWMQSGAEEYLYEVYAREFIITATSIMPMSSEFRVNEDTTGEQRIPDIAFVSDDTYYITWASDDIQGGDYEGIYIRKFVYQSQVLYHETKTSLTSEGSPTNPCIGIGENENFVISWTKVTDTKYGNDIYVQKYTLDAEKNAVKVGGETLVNTFLPDGQLNPRTSFFPSSNKYIITWHSYSQDGSNFGIYANIFDF